MAQRWTQTVTIPISGGTYTISAANDFGGGAKDIGVIMPATWVAAVISFQVSTAIDGTYVNLYKEHGEEVTAAVAQGLTQSLGTAVQYLSPFRWVKVRSGSIGAPGIIDQTAARTLTFVFER